MTVLRIDPWEPEFGASVEAEDDPDRPPPPLEFDEPLAWAPITCMPPATVPCCAFIDGVRRVDTRLFAEEADVVAPALAGSWAVGVAWSSRPPVVDTVKVRRVIVLGRGLDHGTITASIGGHRIEYRVVASDARTPKQVLDKLQDAMRTDEAALAQAVADTGRAEVIVQDGPLDYHGGKPTVGLVKRQTQRYLDTERQRLLAMLEVGQRTPLFRFERGRIPRYSWYARIAPRRRIDGSIAGLVRLESHQEAGLEETRRLADTISGMLPSFAAPMWRDARAPQNLYPVGQLETVLRNRLGERDVVRRAVEAALWRMLDD